jgi:hypothetical protein
MPSGMVIAQFMMIAMCFVFTGTCIYAGLNKYGHPIFFVLALLGCGMSYLWLSTLWER